MSNHIVVDATEARLVRKLVESGGYTPDEALAAVREAAERVRQARQERAGRAEAPAPEETPVEAVERAPGPYSVSVQVPMAPPAELFPNKRHRRGGLHPGIAAAKEYREVTQYAAMEHVNGTPFAGPVHLIIHAAYGHKRRVPDLDATISATKPAVDALADAGLIYDDDQVAMITATHEKLTSTRRHKPTGFTTLTITEMQS